MNPSKSKYDPAYCEVMMREMAKGHSLVAVAAEIGVTRQTFDNWRKTYPEFQEAFEMGKVFSTRYWERRLIELSSDKDAGNPAAVIFGLKNRAPDQWRDKMEHEHSGPGGGPVKLDVKVKFV